MNYDQHSNKAIHSTRIDSAHNKRRVCYVATADFILNWFLSAHIKAQSSLYDITIITDGKKDNLIHLLLDGNTRFIHLPVKRDISLFNDVYVLIWLIKYFKSEHFDCVHSIMMKSGLLAMIAANIAGVPLRFHTFTGQRWVTKKGLFRAFLQSMDRRIAANATHVFADSMSQRFFMNEHKICDISRVTVLGDGSITGVDTKRFIPNYTIRQTVRAGCNICADDIVFLFVGRLSVDKGLIDLMQAFDSLKQSTNNIHLMIVGPDEEGLEAELERFSKKLPGSVHIMGSSDTPEHYMAAADVLCLPSYREGFGNVIIEAASVGIPAIASRIYGITDAVEENIAGILHSVGSIQEIVHAMSIMVTNKSLRLSMGRAARERALVKFPQERLTKALINFHDEKHGMWLSQAG